MDIDIKLSATVSVFLTGWIGIIFAFNSMLADNETGAGVCLIASALAFGFVMVRK